MFAGAPVPVLFNMHTNCVIYVSGDNKNPVLGVVVGEPSEVRGAIQQYQKAVGPVVNRTAFNDFVRQYKLQLGACTPIDTVTI